MFSFTEEGELRRQKKYTGKYYLKKSISFLFKTAVNQICYAYNNACYRTLRGEDYKGIFAEVEEVQKIIAENDGHTKVLQIEKISWS